MKLIKRLERQAKWEFDYLIKDLQDDKEAIKDLKNTGFELWFIDIFLRNEAWEEIRNEIIINYQSEQVIIMDKKEIKKRLEYLRGEIRAERISTGEIVELQSLKKYIEPGDVELLEWAGVTEKV